MPIYMQYGGIAARKTPHGLEAFEIKDFSFDVENPTTIGSGTKGAGAGKITFNDFNIHQGVETARPVLAGSKLIPPKPRYQIVVSKPIDPWSHSLRLRRRELEVSIVFADPGRTAPRHSLKLNAVIVDIKPHSPSFGGGALTGYEKLTLAFSEYYFNGSRNAPPQMISLIAAPFTRATS
jgi:hypothetical protein